MKYYREQTLESIARNLIKGYDPALLRGPCAIPIEEIMEQQHGLIVVYQYLRKNGKILGRTAFSDTCVPIYDAEYERYLLLPVKRGTVVVDAGLLEPRQAGRLRFTLAHELAHWLLHQEEYAGSGQVAAMTDGPRLLLEEDQAPTGTAAAVERQADLLGSFILMPAGAVKMGFHRHHPHPDAAGELARVFGVSKQAMAIRLRELGLI